MLGKKKKDTAESKFGMSLADAAKLISVHAKQAKAAQVLAEFASDIAKLENRSRELETILSREGDKVAGLKAEVEQLGFERKKAEAERNRAVMEAREAAGHEGKAILASAEKKADDIIAKARDDAKAHFVSLEKQIDILNGEIDAKREEVKGLTADAATIRDKIDLDQGKLEAIRTTLASLSKAVA